jgi:hypothetical protein
MEDQDPEIGPTIHHNDPPKPLTSPSVIEGRLFQPTFWQIEPRSRRRKEAGACCSSHGHLFMILPSMILLPFTAVLTSQRFNDLTIQRF